ncbi:MAG TPA: hypothetical protein VNM92_06830 [Thermoanaerobaculia bacterium]|nr:hypothetical protein [Thermoanaerobaculia bacterium]
MNPRNYLRERLFVDRFAPERFAVLVEPDFLFDFVAAFRLDDVVPLLEAFLALVLREEVLAALRAGTLTVTVTLVLRRADGRFADGRLFFVEAFLAGLGRLRPAAEVFPDDDFFDDEAFFAAGLEVDVFVDDDLVEEDRVDADLAAELFRLDDDLFGLRLLLEISFVIAAVR